VSEASSKTNDLGLEKKDYQGEKSTLCIGCGHDQITREIVEATYLAGVDPYNVVKTSGIGCSSKTPAYFIRSGYGINSVHGRMPSVATGANMANKHLVTVGVSGDGDTASIGMGQFCHAVRRNTNMVYIVENNGVYGLTKGQFSATSEKGAKKKGGVRNDYGGIDLCALAIELGATFVARSFSGDTKQMTTLLRAAIAHNGFALIDCISPCVTFNNLPDSQKGFEWLRDNNVQLHELGFVPEYDAKKVEQEAGQTYEIALPDGNVLMLHALGTDHDPRDFESAHRVLVNDRLDEGHVFTGLIYINEESQALDTTMNLPDKPLSQHEAGELRPEPAAFEQLLAGFR